MTTEKPTQAELANYPLEEIFRAIMFRSGDVEFPIDECLAFVQTTVFPRIKSVVENGLLAHSRRDDEDDVQLDDLLDQFRKNQRFIKQLYTYATKLEDSVSISKAYEDEEDEESLTERPSSSNSTSLSARILRFAEAVGLDVESIESFTPDPAKLVRDRRIAARTAAMPLLKYERFAAARTYSFLRTNGHSSPTFERGFRYYAGVPDTFNKDLLNVVNFCAIELVTSFVERADRIRCLETKETIGLPRDPNKRGAILLEHYRTAARLMETPGAAQGGAAATEPSSSSTTRKRPSRKASAASRTAKKKKAT